MESVELVVAVGRANAVGLPVIVIAVVAQRPGCTVDVAEGGVVAAEYADMYGEHAYDAEGNFIGEAGENAEATPAEASVEAPAEEAPAEETSE